MAIEKRNTYLDAGVSDDSEHDTGYDSEAAEISKAGRTNKRRKVEHDYSNDEDDNEDIEQHFVTPLQSRKTGVKATNKSVEEEEDDDERDEDNHDNEDGHEIDGEQEEHEDESAVSRPRHRPSPTTSHKPTSQPKQNSKDKKKQPTPGVIYLSSLPPYLKPSALRNLLSQRGFGPITRLFLSPTSKSHKSSSASTKNSRQLYTEGWLEFASKKTARRCAETLNATTVGGKKGGYYRDDVWNMKYLRGMGWEELMAGVREEKREVEGRRDEERRIIARETREFVEGVEEGKRLEGMKRKREGKVKNNMDAGVTTVDGGDGLRTWRQNEVKGVAKGRDNMNTQISDDVRQVLDKIF